MRIMAFFKLQHSSWRLICIDASISLATLAPAIHHSNKATASVDAPEPIML
jgi:hypothetical protein